MSSVIDSHSSAVIATGGGIILRVSNRKVMSATGRVVYLSATKAQLYERTKRDKKRPLLQVTDRRAVIDELFDLRDPLYRSLADIVFTSGSVRMQRVANDIAEQLCKP